MPWAMLLVFAIYVIWLAFFKKEFGRRLKTEVLPGLFFVVVWGIGYALFLR